MEGIQKQNSGHPVNHNTSAPIYSPSGRQELTKVRHGKTGNEIKPWQNPDGKLKSNEEITEAAKTWTPATWEEYLTTLEKPQTEFLLNNPRDIENISAAEYTEMLIFLMKHDEHPVLKRTIEAGLKKLSPREKEVIHLYYWDNCRQHEIAEGLGITRGTVKKLLDRARIKIKTHLVSGTLSRLVRAAKTIKVASSQGN